MFYCDPRSVCNHISLCFMVLYNCMNDAVFVFTQSLGVNQVSLHFCSHLTVVSLVSLCCLQPR